MTNSIVDGEFEVYLGKADFKFNCSHFIAYKGFRERLHGHNYRIYVRVIGGKNVCDDGYLMDFGDIKKVTRAICSQLNEYFIVPEKADAMIIEDNGEQYCLTCEDGAKFAFPKSDCKLLPIVHSSAEEIAHYLWGRIIRTIGLESLLNRDVRLLEVSVAEAPQQQATFRCKIPLTEEELLRLEQTPVKIKPLPCLDSN